MLYEKSIMGSHSFFLKKINFLLPRFSQIIEKMFNEGKGRGDNFVRRISTTAHSLILTRKSLKMLKSDFVRFFIKFNFLSFLLDIRKY